MVYTMAAVKARKPQICRQKLYVDPRSTATTDAPENQDKRTTSSAKYLS